MDDVIEILELNSLNQLRISLTTFQSYRRLDIRHWYREGELRDNEWKPTKKGINLSVDLIADFRKALDKVFSQVEMGGTDGD